MLFGSSFVIWQHLAFIADDSDSHLQEMCSLTESFLLSADSAVYQLFVRATDGGSEPQVADVPVDVVVLADSKDLPVFDPPTTGAQGVFLTESDPVGEYNNCRVLMPIC